jgi:cyanophycinase
MTRLILLLLFFTIFIQSKGSVAQESNITAGYKNGSLIVIGGGHVPDDIMRKFRNLAGGDSAKIVVIPTANVLNNKIDTLSLKAYFEKHGFMDITILHTSDTSEANKNHFIQPIKEATGIYFMGGRQWRIADGFLNTKAHDEMFKLLDRGGVIAGSSAGATIQGSYLARGDSKNNQIMMGDHEVGLGFISNIAIDQHVMARNRQFDMFTILDNKPELLGIGIDESTAIVVKGDIFKVIGKSYVIIYDNSFWSREGYELKQLPNKNEMFYYLRSEDEYNLRERKVIEK